MRSLAEARRPPAWWPLALALVVPAAAGSIALLESFDGLYGQDPFAYFGYATGAMRQSLLHLHGPPPFFWPPAYPFVVAVVSLAVGPVPLAGQLVSLAAGALVPVFTALLAREIWSPPERESRDRSGWVAFAGVPVIAGVLVACTGQLWQSSVVVMADTLGLAAATAGAWALACYGRRRDLSWLLLAAGLLAAATVTRWIYGVVAAPFAVYALLVACRQQRATALAHLGLAASVAAAVLAPVTVVALRDVVGSDGAHAAFAGDFGVYGGWSPLRAFHREFTTADGTLSYALPTGLYYAVAPARWAFLTPLLAPLIVPGAWAVIRRASAAPVLLLLGWAGAVYAFHAGAAYQNFRFTLAYLPPLAILAAIGLHEVARWLGAVSTRRAYAVAGLAAVFAVGLAAMAADGVHSTRNLIAQKNDGLAIVRWTEARVPEDARLITFNLTSTFRRYSRLQTSELYEQEPTRLTVLVASRPAVFLLVDVSSVEGQWRRRSPGRAFRWLERNPGLTPIGAHGGFTLFRVATPARRAGHERRAAAARSERRPAAAP